MDAARQLAESMSSETPPPRYPARESASEISSATISTAAAPSIERSIHSTSPGALTAATRHCAPSARRMNDLADISSRTRLGLRWFLQRHDSSVVSHVNARRADLEDFDAIDAFS